MKTCILKEEKEELIVTGNSSIVTPTPYQAQQRNHNVTHSINNRKMSHNKENSTPSTPHRPASSSTSSATQIQMSIPSSASIRRQKLRNLSEIYQKSEVDNS